MYTVLPLIVAGSLIQTWSVMLVGVSGICSSISRVPNIMRFSLNSSHCRIQYGVSNGSRGLTIRGNMVLFKNALVFYADISKYLRHSVATASKHYNFGAVEESARGREAVVGSSSGKDIDTASNSTIGPDEDLDIENMTDKQVTTRLFERLHKMKPMTIGGKVPTMDDVRGIAEFQQITKTWTKTKQDFTAKAVSSR